MSKFVFNKEQELRNAGCENVDSYMLVNNYGYTFIKDGIKYDLRHWLNCYGADVNYWSLDGHQIDSKDYVRLDKSTFKTFEEALEFIKTI